MGSVPVSRVLYLLAVNIVGAHTRRCLSFILSVCRHTALAFYPLPRASNPQTAVYMNLQLPRCTAERVTTPLVSSYLTFSPFQTCGESRPVWWGEVRRHGCCYFLLHYSTLADCFYIRKWDALCCPDFPLDMVLLALHLSSGRLSGCFPSTKLVIF